jgi:hypothetical protein
MTREFLQPDKLLFVRRSLEGNDIEGLADLLERPGDVDLRATNIFILLPLLHEARKQDDKNFWIDLFLPWISIQRSVQAHHDRILGEFARIGALKHDSQEFLIHLVNVYRSIVSDLLDPYMTLLVACFQFIERKFRDIQHANVGLGERNKVEYLESRIRKVDPENRLLSGYDPIVRNAVTHTGSDGVVYHSDGALFRNIKRGTSPVVETVEWSRDTLINKVVRLYECIISTDAAVNVFAVDCGELMLEDEDVKSEFMQRALALDHRARLRAPFEELMQRIRDDKNLPDKRRFELLSQVLLYNCAKQEMPVHGIRVSNEKATVMVEVPDPKKDLGDDEVLRDAVMEFSHYAILTRSVFGPDFDHFVVRAVRESGQPLLTITLAGHLLEQYIQERAGLYDLLHEADIRLDENKIAMSVDFDKLAELERNSLDRSFPRKARPGGNS